MASSHPHIGNLVYNAAEARFEALVTFHTDEGRIRIPSSSDAPLDASPEHVRKQLISDALIGRSDPGRVRSRVMPRAPEPSLRNSRGRTPLAGAIEWLRRLNAA
ncbi:hypothetical protein Q4543_11845 [Salipiger sp. 1_MG-2023]|uniref:hypothetical protein n=1 Tax=Salipiger sp. 1_MG-2023 TaxID=3062665 RepID=UPI0026E3FE68|nr:hypothetical protein [Salipiger sp. 1_MG-2023]MDO6586207.1 hypothetical protein [Salipiger sp. 1_MG-2023]